MVIQAWNPNKSGGIRVISVTKRAQSQVHCLISKRTSQTNLFFGGGGIDHPTTGLYICVLLYYYMTFNTTHWILPSTKCGSCTVWLSPPSENPELIFCCSMFPCMPGYHCTMRRSLKAPMCKSTNGPHFYHPLPLFPNSIQTQVVTH